MKDFVKRLIVERDELAVKWEKLRDILERRIDINSEEGQQE